MNGISIKKLRYLVTKHSKKDKKKKNCNELL